MNIKISILATFLFGIIKLAGAQDTTSIYDLTPDENLNNPSIQSKHSSAVVRHIDGLINYFKKLDYTAEARRRGEVACIIIEADKLFAPNDTVLKPKASVVLNHFQNIVRLPDMYKLVILCHSDDTADETYSDYLTEVRANAVDEYLEGLINNPNIQPNIIPYGMSFEEPRFKNNSLENRRLNRRVEIYIVPEARLIKMASDGKLN